jgi:cytochrome c oxidase assembly protein subunit 15
MAARVTGEGGAHRFACATAGATVGLIVAGGLVTNTGSELAVPDWPTTFGHNMFLYPWSGMVGGILIEHGHRLVGALIGLLTVALGVTLALAERRRWVRWLGGLAIGLVVLQGAIGGLRVVLLEHGLAIVHGCLAQVFFALLVTLAVVTGRGWAAPASISPAGARLAGPALGAAAVLYAQVVLGALTTHAGWLWWHVGGAVAVTGVVVGVAVLVLRRAGDDPVLAWWARALKGLLALQLGLGLGAYAARFTGVGLPGGQASVIALPVVHRAVGALVLGAVVALALHLGRRRAERARRALPDGAPALASTEVAA